MASHTSKHRFIPIGGSQSGQKHASETEWGFYSFINTFTVQNANATDKKRRKSYALEMAEYLFGWKQELLHLKFASEYSHLIGNTYVYYLMMGKIILGKVTIDLTMIMGKRLDMTYDYYEKMDYRRYKSYNHLAHNNAHYANITTDREYTENKHRNRRRLKWLKTK